MAKFGGTAADEKDSTAFFVVVEGIHDVHESKEDVLKVPEVDENDVKPTEVVNVKMELDMEHVGDEIEFVTFGKESERESDAKSDEESDSDFEPSDSSSAPQPKLRARRLRKTRNIPQTMDEETMKMVLKYIQLKCDLCCDEQEFDTYTEVRIHFLEAHKQKAYFICCNQKFTRLGRMIQHCKFHENPEAFK